MLGTAHRWSVCLGIASNARLNNITRRLGGGWAIYTDAVRRETTAYPRSRFPDPISALLDGERRAGFESVPSRCPWPGRPHTS
jgi:type IV secretion system protein TrbE